MGTEKNKQNTTAAKALGYENLIWNQSAPSTPLINQEKKDLNSYSLKHINIYFSHQNYGFIEMNNILFLHDYK